MVFDLHFILDEERSNPRRKEYLVKNGEKLMFVFRIITPPRGLEDCHPSYKFEPILSIGMVPDIGYALNELFVTYEPSPASLVINADEIDKFIEDTAFAKEMVQYVIEQILPEYK